jgi:hypothetical protein
VDIPDLIGGQYQLDPSSRNPISIGGQRAYPAIDRRDPSRPIVAIQVDPSLPPRQAHFTQRAMMPVPHSMMPIEQGPARDPNGKEAWFIICHAPPGPALSSGPRGWTPNEVIRQLLLPAAAALEGFQERGITHRAIRPDNVFRAGPGEPVVLGPCWAAPPACFQPAAFEPIYSAMCLRAGRGNGTVADDVYALGVTMLWCVLPDTSAWEDKDALIWRKLANGSVTALAGDNRIPSILADMLQGMLAEDPEHRPPPSMLLDPGQTRSRRLATRPQARASRPLVIGKSSAYTPRELAYCLARDPERGALMLRTNVVDNWLRRMVGDGALAAKVDDAAMRRSQKEEIEEAIRPAVLVMRAVIALDPLAPLVWRGIALFPNGLGAALADACANAQNPALVANLEELINHEAAALWAMCKSGREDVVTMIQDSRQWRTMMSGSGGGIRRLTYALNPMLPCTSPLLGGRMAIRMADLLPCLEAASLNADRLEPPYDAHIAAFAAARGDQSIAALAIGFDGLKTESSRLRVMSLFLQMQNRMGGAPLPGLAGWLNESGVAALPKLRSVTRRKAMAARMSEQATAGNIAGMLMLLQDETARADDKAEAEHAENQLADIARKLHELEASGPDRARAAQMAGHALAAGLGFAATLFSATLLALSL